MSCLCGFECQSSPNFWVPLVSNCLPLPTSACHYCACLCQPLPAPACICLPLPASAYLCLPLTSAYLCCACLYDLSLLFLPLPYLCLCPASASTIYLFLCLPLLCLPLPFPSLPFLRLGRKLCIFESTISIANFKFIRKEKSLGMSLIRMHTF